MSIQNMTVNPTGTWAVTAGSALALKLVGQSLTQNRQAVDEAVIFPLRRSVDFSYKGPTVNANSPDGYTQRRNSCFIRMPILTASGLYTTNTVSITVSTSVEMTDAQILEMRLIASSALTDLGMNDFYNEGVLE